ncbi:MAG: glycosyltransferase family 4 protein [Chloroflexi bacterium]|nr:glycosyltransferase family 4 protein [Chloroflexota bacterium]
MRVLMLSWEYPPHSVGGLGRHVTDLLPALDRCGVSVQVLTPRWRSGDPIEPIGQRCQVHRVDPPAEASERGDFVGCVNLTNMRLADYAGTLIRDSGPFDLIHAHDWLVTPAATALKHQQKTPLVATVHATEWGRNRGHLTTELQFAINNVEWRLTYEAWRVVTCSNYMAREVRQIFQTPSDKVDVIPNGVDIEHFSTLRNGSATGFGPLHAEPLGFYVGRIVPEKGIDVLLDAIATVVRQHGPMRFVFAGTGPHLERAREHALQLGLDGNVQFAGFISDKDRDAFYREASVAVIPSLYEPFGIVALEAMAARVPVVASRVGGLAEVIHDESDGLLVEPGDATALGASIVRTLTETAETAARVERAFELVKTEFTWDAIAQRTRFVYDRVVDERRNSPWR